MYFQSAWFLRGDRSSEPLVELLFRGVWVFCWVSVPSCLLVLLESTIYLISLA